MIRDTQLLGANIKANLQAGLNPAQAYTKAVADTLAAQSRAPITDEEIRALCPLMLDAQGDEVYHVTKTFSFPAHLIMYRETGAFSWTKEVKPMPETKAATEGYKAKFIGKYAADHAVSIIQALDFLEVGSNGFYYRLRELKDISAEGMTIRMAGQPDTEVEIPDVMPV